MKTALPYYFAILISFVFGILVNQTISNKVVGKVQAETITIEEKSPLLSFNDDKLSELLITDFWAHDNVDGCDYLCRFSKHNFKAYEMVSENLYKGDCNMLNAFELWKASPTHLEVLKTGFDEVVMTGKVDASGQCYVVMNLSSL